MFLIINNFSFNANLIMNICVNIRKTGVGGLTAEVDAKIVNGDTIKLFYRYVSDEQDKEAAFTAIQQTFFIAAIVSLSLGQNNNNKNPILVYDEKQGLDNFKELIDTRMLEDKVNDFFKDIKNEPFRNCNSKKLVDFMNILV